MHFTGQDWDSESNLTHFMFRQLSTTEGRWITPDPAGMGAVSPGDPQTWNRYAYVGNNPPNAVDPQGLLPRTSDAIQYLRDMAHTALLFGRFEFFFANIPQEPIPTEDIRVDGTDVSSVTTDTDGNVIDTGEETTDPMWVTILRPDLAKSSGGTGWSLFGWDANAWKTFFKEAINPIPEFRHGGCGRVFVRATLDALNPLSPSLSSGGEATAAFLAASKYNAALRYAASQPNYLGGTGLIYPMKSSAVRSMLADANATAAQGGLITLDLALAQGAWVEGRSLLNGECH